MDWIKALQQYQNRLAQNNPILGTVQKVVQPVGNAIQDFAKGAFIDGPGQGMQSPSQFEQMGDMYANSDPSGMAVSHTVHGALTAAGHATPFLHGAGPMVMGALSKAPDFFKEAENAPKMLPSGNYPVFQNNYPDVTTKTLRQLEGKNLVAPGFIQNAMNTVASKEGLAQPERDLITNTLAKYPGGTKVPVQDFADRVHSQLMPLTPQSYEDKWSEYTLGERNLSNPDDYEATVYNSPHQVSNGQAHFSAPNYFGHARVEKNDGDFIQPSQEAIDKYVADKAQNLVEKPDPNHPEYYRVYDKTTGEPVSAASTVPNGSMEQILSYLPGEARQKLGTREPGTHSVQEIQSDLFQQNRYKNELQGGYDPQKDLEQGQQNINYYNERIAGLQQRMKEDPGNADRYQSNIESYQRDLERNQKSMQQLQGEIAKYGQAPNAGELIKQSRSISSLQDDLATFEERENQSPGYWTGEINHTKQRIADANSRLAELQTPEHLAQVGNKSRDLTSYKNDAWWKRLVRERIAQSAREGAGNIQFPTGDTAAKIEGYVNPGQEGRFDYGDYYPGDEVYDNYDGGNHVVLDQSGNELLTVPKSEYHGSHHYKDIQNEEMNSVLDDRATYGHELISKMPDTAQKYATRLAKKEGIGENAYSSNDMQAVLDKVEEKYPGTLENAAMEHVKGQMGDSADEVARYLTDNGLATWAGADGDNVHMAGEEPEWRDMSSEGNGEFPEDIRGELPESQQRVYDFYDKDIRKYLQKIRGQDVREVQDGHGNSWLHFPLKEKDKGPVDAWMMVPPIALGALSANQMASQQQNKQ